MNVTTRLVSWIVAALALFAIGCSRTSPDVAKAKKLLVELEKLPEGTIDDLTKGNRTRFEAVNEMELLPAGAASALLKALKDKNYKARPEVAMVLEWFGSPAVRDALIEALEDSDRSLRGRAADSLTRMADEKVFSALESMAARPDSIDRQIAIRAIGTIDGARSRTDLIKATSDSASGVRSMAIRMLDNYPSQESVHAVEGHLNDPSPSVRAAAEVVLCHLAPNHEKLTPVFAKYTAYANSKSEDDRRSALGFFLQCEHPSAANYFLAFVDELDRIRKSQAMKALGHCSGRPDVVKKLLLYTRSADPWDRGNANNALGELRAKEATRRLLELTGSPVFSDVSTSTEALRKIGGIGVRQKMLELVHRPEDYVCSQAALYLEEHGSPERVIMPAIKVLEKTSQSASPTMRATAAGMLFPFKAPAAKRILKRLESDPSPNVRETAKKGRWYLRGTVQALLQDD